MDIMLVPTIGIIRVISTMDQAVLLAHETVIKKLYPELNIVSRAISNQPFGVYDDKTEEIAIPKILTLAKEMEVTGLDGIIISCCVDPGLNLIKQHLSIPVIGAGQAACVKAKAIATKIGVMSILDSFPPNIESQLGTTFIAYEKIEGVTNTLDLLKDNGKQKVLNTAQTLLKKGAQCILLACTGLATIGIADIIEKELAVPAIDPIEASGSLMLDLLKRDS